MLVLYINLEFGNTLKRSCLMKWLISFIVCLWASYVQSISDHHSANVFSANGDLLQVDYAEIAAGRGYSAVCIPTSNRELIICTESNRIDDILLDRRLVDKVSRLDDNVWMIFSGMRGDGQALVRRGRKFCSNYYETFGCSPSIEGVAKHLGGLQHSASLDADKRPLGINALILGFSEGSDSDPSILKLRASIRTYLDLNSNQADIHVRLNFFLT